MFRGLAAATLSAALVVGGALGTPAFAEESVDTAAQQTESAIPVADASEHVAPQNTDLSASVENPDADTAASESGAVGSEHTPDPASNTAPEGPQGASEVPGEHSNQVEPTPEASAATSEPAVPSEQPEAPLDIALKLTTTVKAKRSLSVQVTATGLPADFAEVSAALIPTGDEASLLGPENQIPALASPKPQVQDGKASFPLIAPVERLTRGTQYVVVLWPNNAKPEPANILARADAAVTAAQWEQLLGVPPQPDWNEKAAVGSFDWGLRDKFREYVTGGIAKGKITVQKPATGSSVYRFPQTSNTWDPKTLTGTVKYAGLVNFWGHDGVLDLNLANPEVTVRNANSAELNVPYAGKMLKIATIDLSAKSASKNVLPDGSVQFRNTQVTLTADGRDVYFEEYMSADMELAPLTFTVGADSKTEQPVKPPTTKPGTSKPKPTPKPVPKPLPPTTVYGGATGAQAAGSLSWGVSSAFSSYVTGPIAKGAVTTSGVGSSGGGYLFPQAAGGSWDTATQTGSVQYSGVISFTGHKGLLSESMSNPTIQVTGPDTGVIYNGGAQWGTLNLAAASKSVGPNGEVTWSGVPVSGGFSGGASGGSQYTLAADPLTFTVGTASGVSYGSTAVSNDSLKRTAAASAPTTSGIRILTDTKKIVPGGEIELEAPGFTAKEREALVVLYPGVIVLDEAAGADASGTVRWIGTIPEDLPLGEYVITVQGSTDAGAVMEVRKPEPKAKAAANQQRVAELAAQAEAGEPAAAGVLPAAEAQATWMWWAASLGLLLVAGVMGGLVVAQRRNAAAAHTPGSGS
ncbi:hypothetical protein GCM10009805_16630 [Leucobacter chromiireducens subsp. solipictus]